MIIKVKKLREDAELPVRAHETDSCVDLFSNEAFTLAPGRRYTVRTGIAIELLDGYEAQVRSRSGLAAKCGIFAMFGTVDQGYRGEICVTLVNSSEWPKVFFKGDRIAQLAVCPVIRPTFVEGAFSDDTDRGTSGFGSTGR